MSAVFKAVGGSTGVNVGDIKNSLRFRASASASLTKTLSTPTSNTSWAMSLFIKRGSLSTYKPIIAGSAAGDATLWFSNTDILQLTNNGGTVVASSTAVFRDPTSFGHLFLRSNGTNIKAYWNGVEVLSYTGTITNFNSAILHRIGAYSTAYYFDGYMSRFCWVDNGGSLTHSDFATFNTEINEWVSKTQAQVKAVVDAGGTNSFMLDFDDATSTTTLGYDKSSKDNNWTCNNFSLTAGTTYDHMLDVPGNSYAVLNPLAKPTAVTISAANSTVTDSNPAQWTLAGTMLVSSGKWVFEQTITTKGGGNCGVGFIGEGYTVNSAAWASGQPSYLYSSFGTYYEGSTSSAYGASYTNGDVIRCELDCDTGEIEFFKNGTSQGVKTGTGLAGKKVFHMVFGTQNTATLHVSTMNCGQQPFVGTPSTGFKSLCQANLPDPNPQLLDPTDHHIDITVTKSGNTNFTLPWDASVYDTFFEIKRRDLAGDWYQIDGLRGYDKILKSNSAAAETTDANVLGVSGTTCTLKSTLADGTYIVSATKAGLTASRQTNTDGSITSTVSRNVDSGFAIVTYTGDGGTDKTIGHGLGTTPALIILKDRDTNSVTGNWSVWHKDNGAYNLYLNTTDARFSSPQANGSIGTSPTSTAFLLDSGSTSGNTVNENGDKYVAYCYADSAIQKSFSYMGAGATTDNAYVDFGFESGTVTIKCSSTTGNWVRMDTVRSTYNVAKTAVRVNTSESEATVGTTYDMDLTALGIKHRASNVADVTAAQTYIGRAWAATTGKYSNAR